MRKTFLAMMPLLTASTFTPLSAFASMQVVCPTEIPQASLKLTDTPARWTPHVASPIYLHAAGAAAGPPETLAQLRPDRSTYADGKATWKVTFNLQGHFPRGKWLECGYGAHNQIVLSKRLPDTTTTCTVDYRKGEHAGEHALTILCQ
jgi:hypothetical protein